MSLYCRAGARLDWKYQERIDPSRIDHGPPFLETKSGVVATKDVQIFPGGKELGPAIVHSAVHGKIRTHGHRSIGLLEHGWLPIDMPLHMAFENIGDLQRLYPVQLGRATLRERVGQ